MDSGMKVEEEERQEGERERGFCPEQFRGGVEHRAIDTPSDTVQYLNIPLPRLTGWIDRPHEHVRLRGIQREEQSG